MTDVCGRDPAEIRALRADLQFSADLRGHLLQFASTWGLFSPRAIDAGTALLLRYIEVTPGDDCLDVGCGYGPIGLTLAKLAPLGRTVLLDKDFVAVEYSRANALRNALTNVEVLLSNGLLQLPASRFDVVATNLPAKSGKEFYQLLFHDIATRLRPGGRFYVVSLSGLRRFVARELMTAFGNCEKLKTSGQYTLALTRRD